MVNYQSPDESIIREAGSNRSAVRTSSYLPVRSEQNPHEKFIACAVLDEVAAGDGDLLRQGPRG